MQRDWYGWLKERIESCLFMSAADCAFLHGQINFAYIADLITEEQMKELNKLIPEY